jgi:hypothetical protein
MAKSRKECGELISFDLLVAGVTCCLLHHPSVLRHNRRGGFVSSPAWLVIDSDAKEGG